MYDLTRGIDSRTDAVRLPLSYNLKVLLKENPSTGYTWFILEPASNPKLQLIGDELIETDSDLLGAPGIRKFIFHPIAKGTQEL